MLLEEKLVVTKLDTASKETIFLNDLIFQSNIGLKISHYKLKNVTQGAPGVRKVLKKCHVLFEWPLIDDVIEYKKQGSKTNKNEINCLNGSKFKI